MIPKIIAAIILLLSIAQLPAVFAFETDQYNLPPTPLADIGEEVAEYTKENLLKAIDNVNVKISSAQTCLKNVTERPTKCENAKALEERLIYLRSEKAIAREVFKQLGAGFVAFAKAGEWMNSHNFRAQPARYKTSFSHSIYVGLPTDYFTISSTVKLYGSSIGTDKIAHFFQQGYTYYRTYERSVAKGLSSDEAVKKAIAWGKMTERTYYGTLVGGVFSNADLAANYAGMKFYEGLTKTIELNGRKRPSTLVLKNGKWGLSESSHNVKNLLSPFISDHLNEALNPSLYIPGLRSSIRGIVRKQSCPQWLTSFPDKSREDYEEITKSLLRWNGEDYGHKKSEKFVTIANTCFGESIAIVR